MKTWKSLMLTSLVLGTGSLVAACGDDEPASDPIDAADHDAEVPDAEPDPTATRAMTIAITDIALTSTDGVNAGIKGGAISAEFSDVTMNGGEVIFGTSTVAGCVVQRFDATHTVHPTVDGGAITLTGDGLLKTVGPCSYVAGAGYLCTSNAAAGSVIAASGGTGGVQYTFTGTPFAGQSLVGSYLNINGYTNANFNTGTSALPVVAQTDSALTVIRQPTVPASTETSATQSFTLAGAGPIPTQTGFPVNADFLGDETTEVTISKAADSDWGAIDFTVYTRGEGFTLSTDSAKPHEFPFTAADVVFDCAGAGGNCGAEGNQPGALEAVIVSGKTTDAPIPVGARDFEMPAPVTAYTTFQCGFILADGGTIPEAAVTAILSTNPTRIETRVLRVAGTQLTEGPGSLNTGNVVVGHGLVGHTTAPN